VLAGTEVSHRGFPSRHCVWREGLVHNVDELGRYCLVECKNWSKPAGLSTVRDFLGKLDRCKTRLGIIFSGNGITGVDTGVDALREIHSRFDRDGVYVIVFLA
jgi:hypothetical protein